MRRLFPALLVSILLHVGLFLLALITWVGTPRFVPVNSVPVEIVASVPQQEMAAAPVDTNAVKAPAPIPQPPEPVQPPIPAPVQPVPVPTKPEKTVEKPVEKAPPDKNGIKKPQPDKPTLDLGALAASAATPPKSRTHQQAQANTHPTNGASNTGAAPNDAGEQAARGELGRRLMGLWNPNCVDEGRNVVLTVRVWPSHGDRILKPADLVDQNVHNTYADAAFSRARAAVAQVEIGDLNFKDDDYTNGIAVIFNAQKACQGQ